MKTLKNPGVVGLAYNTKENELRHEHKTMQLSKMFIFEFNFSNSVWSKYTNKIMVKTEPTSIHEGALNFLLVGSGFSNQANQISIHNKHYAGFFG